MSRGTQASTPPEVYFDPLAHLFERFADITDYIYRPWLLATLTQRGNTAVDLGCGSGRFTGLLADRYKSVLALDIAERELEIARSKRGRPNVAFVRRDIRQVTRVADGQFDLVFSVNTIHHLRDHEHVLPHIHGLVAPGGQAVLIDIVSPGPQWASPGWHRKEAVKDAIATLRRRRAIGDAYAVLRLRSHPIWIRHSTNDIPLTRPEFRRQYADAFPGAEFTDLHPVVSAVRWQKPA